MNLLDRLLDFFHKRPSEDDLARAAKAVKAPKAEAPKPPERRKHAVPFMGVVARCWCGRVHR